MDHRLQTHSHFAPPSSPSPTDDKANYDDLFDEYTTDYYKNSNHQTFSIQSPTIAHASTPQHRRGPSFPLNNQSQSDLSHKPIWDYPPSSSPPVTNKGPSRPFWQKILPDSLYCRLYVLTVVIQTIVDLAIEGELLVRFHQAGLGAGDDTAAGSRKMKVYLGIFVLAHVFQMIMALDAVYNRNTLQVFCLTAFNLAFMIYSIIQIGEIREIGGSLSQQTGISDIPINVLTTIIPCVIAAAELAYIGLGWKIYTEFGWQVYKFLGADRQIKRMYAQFQVFECLVKFDVFFWVAFCVQLIWLVLQKQDWEYYVTVAALPLSIIVLVEGNLAARHENKWMMCTFISGCFGALVYFVYKLGKVITRREGEFALAWKSLTIFSVLSIIMLLITIVFAGILMYNFDRGLKTQLAKKSKSKAAGLTRRGTEYVHRGPMRTHPNRMSID